MLDSYQLISIACTLWMHVLSCGYTKREGKQMIVKGQDLRIGDVVKVWWSKQDVIIGFRPLSKEVWPGHRRAAIFAQIDAGMTVPDDTNFEVVQRGA